jgi:hypothetical protein
LVRRHWVSASRHPLSSHRWHVRASFWLKDNKALPLLRLMIKLKIKFEDVK